jgi:hypothetical protein
MNTPDTQTSQVTQAELDIARTGVLTQYECMFDADVRDQLAELGIDRFLDYVITTRASNMAQIRFYSNCLHPK